MAAIPTTDEHGCTRIRENPSSSLLIRVHPWLKKSSRAATISGDTDRVQLCDTAQRSGAATQGARVCDQLCSARKTRVASCLSLPARNERGESRREGKLSTSSPRPSPPFLRRRGRESAVARSKQILCRTQLVCDRQDLCRPPSVLTNPARRPLSTCCGSQSRA